MALTQDQINRYSRHLLLPEVGVEGQEKICNSKVLLIGTGGLGSPLALYLAAAGVGNLGLIDFDVVDLRQLAKAGSTWGVDSREIEGGLCQSSYCRSKFQHQCDHLQHAFVFGKRDGDFCRLRHHC